MESESLLLLFSYLRAFQFCSCIYGVASVAYTALLHVTFTWSEQWWKSISVLCSMEQSCDHSCQRDIYHVKRKQLSMISGRCQLLVTHLEKQLLHKHSN